MHIRTCFWLFTLCHCVEMTLADQKQGSKCDMVPPEPSDRFAPLCPMIDKCPDKRAFTAAHTARGCFCDIQCRLYGDCCGDYANHTDVKELLSETFTCRKVDGVWSNNLPVYIVDKCPASWKKDGVRRQCESSTNDTFLNWPLSDDRAVMYRNLACLRCNGKSSANARWWTLNVLCGQLDNVKISYKDVLKEWKANSCNLTFTHPDEDHTSRKCKINIMSCPTSWTDKCTRGLCESPTASVQYRYDIGSKEKTFRNPYCALCHGSSITCEDVVTKKYLNPRPYSQVYGKNHALSVSIDLNLDEIVERRLGKVTKKVPMTSCERGYMYDVFSDSCRAPEGTFTDNQQTVDKNGPSNDGAKLSLFHMCYFVLLFSVL